MLYKKSLILILVLFLSILPILLIAQETNTITKSKAVEEMSLQELLEVPISYGFKKSPLQLHVFMNTALWNFQKQAIGSYANEGSSSYTGRPFFISYSGYISSSCQINENLYVEAEFELYKGEKGQFKVCRLRQIWTPSKYFKVTLGRDFPPIGVPEKIYYPPSQFRLFAMAPYLYWSVSHLTGWWDSGIILTGTIPFGSMKLITDVFVMNGPGDQGKSFNLETQIKPNSEGYMWEYFIDKARQPWDNNKSKHLGARLSFFPLKNLEFGASYADGKYDKNDKYNATFTFAHLLYGGERLTVAAEYGQLQLGVPTENMTVTNVNKENGTWMNNHVTQYSYYISLGYKILNKKYVNYFEPVIRYEYMDSWKEDTTNKGDRQLIWLGFRLSPYKYWVIKTGYSWQREPYGPSLQNDGCIIESVVEF